MIWLAWRQFRVQALAALGALALLAVVLLVTGPHLVQLYDTTVAHCSAHGDCSTATSALIADGDRVGIVLRVVVEVVPALIGLFWGRPSSPVNLRPEPTVWPGRRSRGPAGCSSSSVFLVF